MTCIAYRAGIMAADTAVWSGNLVPYHIKKIARIGAMLVASSGPTALCIRFREWVTDGMNGNFDRSDVGEYAFDGLIVLPEGRVLKIEAIGKPLNFDAPFYTCGSGQEIMTGAMAAGATAEQAVKIAITYTDHAAGGIQVEKLHNDELVEKIVGAPFPAAA